ncbi:MAG TPA: hypothetical protein VGV38_07430 [Pyrinomonadaceae bacterium]|nr:hypothetical protein [Pyrinomonadaceae bacterium]
MLRYVFYVTAVCCVLVLSGAVGLKRPVEAGRRPAAGPAVVVAAQSCADCENKCSGFKKRCENGTLSACYRAAECLCQCNLDAGGCGSSKKALQDCVESSRKAAEELENPGER